MSRISQITVLAEDQAQHSLIRRYIERATGSTRQIQAHPVCGKGSGEHYVRREYPRLLQDCRQRMASTLLVVAIDADVYEVSLREEQLAAALHQANVSPVAEDDCVVILIPKRNVETWIRCLWAEPVDEVKDYSRNAIEKQKMKEAAETLFSWTRPNANVASVCVPSLRRALPGWKRIE